MQEEELRFYFAELWRKAGDHMEDVRDMVCVIKYPAPKLEPVPNWRQSA